MLVLVLAVAVVAVGLATGCCWTRDNLGLLAPIFRSAISGPTLRGHPGDRPEALSTTAAAHYIHTST